MRNALTTTVGMAFLLATACSSSTHPDGGSSTGATGGTGCGDIANGDACGSDMCCTSGVCGVNGTGHCCAAKCPVGGSGLICSTPTDCDSNGACVYAAAGTQCGTTCASDMLTTKSCDGAGGCGNPKTTACPSNLGCGATACNAGCSADAGGCAINYFCNNGTCAQQIDTGPCNGDDAECSSGLCAPNLYCCREKCPHDKYPECSITACTADAGGSCVYPPTTTVCDKADESCTGSTLHAGACNGMGTCDLGNSSQCPNNLGCDQANMGCVLYCTTDRNCAAGFYCNSVLGTCVAQVADGGCLANDQCISGICGASGTGHCCAAACGKDPACGATDCDGTTEACNYPKQGTACGTPPVPLSCATVGGKDVQTNPTICNGLGVCLDPANPATTFCSPFVCDGTGTDAGCYSTCKDATACIATDFCDTTAASCCGAIGATLTVDSTVGKDAACCGFGVNKPCQTLSYAMKLIDSSKTTGVVISATVGGNNGGDWAPAGEVYPIVLGWEAELNAPGVAFVDPNSVGGNGKVGKAIFDVKAYANDATASPYASIIGAAQNPIIIGMNSKFNQQSNDTTAILVEGGNTLYLAAANVNGNSNPPTAAITVQADGTLTLGKDQGATIHALVTIGTTQGLTGGTGILCGSAKAAKSCTVNDSSPGMGLSAVVIENQANNDIDAEDMASINLSASPVIGVAPRQPGFTQCTNNKTDASGKGLNLAAILLRGSAKMTFDNGTVQCVSADGFLLIASANGTPTLTMDSSTIQNTEVGLFASAGTATVTKSSIQFNFNGVEQETDALGSAVSVDLSGGGNSVICSSNKESVVMMPPPGVDVLNTTSTDLKANKTAWDTTGPDEFSCNAALTACTCASGTCTGTAGNDGMDAVYTGTGTVITTLGSQSPIAKSSNCN